MRLTGSGNLLCNYLVMNENQIRILSNYAESLGIEVPENVPVQNREITVNQIKFHYLDWGKSDNPPILMLHGLAQTSRTWDLVALALSNNYRSITIDQRGHGDSGWSTNQDYSHNTLLEDTIKIIDKLNLDKFVLVGFSMGGKIALSYAENHSNRLSAMVVVDSGPESNPKGTESVRKFLEQQADFVSVDELVSKTMQYNSTRPMESIRASIMNSIKQLDTGKWVWKYDPGIKNRISSKDSEIKLQNQLWASVNKIECPTLIMHATHSNILTKSTALKMQSIIKGSKLVSIKNASHLVVGDNPVDFIKELKLFLSTIYADNII